MLYRFLIGLGHDISPDFDWSIRYMRDSANALFIEMPGHIAECVNPHLVGYMWETFPTTKQTLRFALFEDATSALMCELWYPRINFYNCPTFSTEIDESTITEGTRVNRSELPPREVAPF